LNIFKNITNVAHNFGQLFTYIMYEGILVGLHFGRFFHNLIWSPCSKPAFIYRITSEGF
jgi:hypothetical protein